MLKPRICILALAAIAATGCSGRPEGRGGVTVEVWSGWTGQEAVSFQRLCDEFNRSHPGVRIHNRGGVTDNSMVIRAITAGVPPDCFTIWNAGDVGPLAAYGAISNLDAQYKASGLKEEDLVPGAVDQCKYRGHFIGVPLLMDTNALFWNKDAFREAGLDPERPPRTMAELKDYAVRLTLKDRSGDIRRLGLMLPDTTLLCWVFGGDFVDSSGRPTADTPANIRAFKFYKALVDGMGGRERVEAFGSGFGVVQGPNHPFFVGKVAMMVNGEWIPSWIERYAPRLHYGVAPVPYEASRPDLKGTTLIGVNLLAIPTEAKHPGEAWEFLRWLQRPEVQLEFAQALNNVPNTRSALRMRRLTTGSEARRNYGKFWQIAQNVHARGFPVSPVGQLYQDELGRATEFVMFGTKTPEAALADLQAKVEKELKAQRKGNEEIAN
ncbi:MAG TPA: ABC transporter substrate-binding protein [Armatimonadota bacterium]|jgi:multiple sugar transport system substrate-binding protein